MSIRTRLLLLIIPFLAIIQEGYAGTNFTKSEFANRRARLMEKIDDGIAIILGAPAALSDRQFFQSNDFYYFTGVEIPDAALIIDGLHKESILFFTMNETQARGEGIAVELIRNPEEVTGIEKVFTMEQFSAYLSKLSLQSKRFYTMFKPGEQPRENSNEKFRAFQKAITMKMWDGRLTRELQFVRRLKEKFPYITVLDCSPLVWDLRKIKSPAEIALIRRAAQIGVQAHLAVIKKTAPGVQENELAALFEYMCKKAGAQELAFYTIIMSGPNHAFGHYHKHDRTLDDGDFIILDAGPDYGYYDADISSTFPANGEFSPRQREVYELALGIRQTCLENYRPGVTFRSVGEQVKQFLIRRGYDPNERRFASKIRYGGYNHSIGMATHDAMGTWIGPDEVMQPGFVFACDINMPYAEEEMGVRLEDTVLITKTGYEILSKGIPRSIKEVETIMKQN